MWHLEEMRGSLDMASLALEVEVMRPEAGLGRIRIDGQALPDAAILQVHSLEWEASDSKSRDRVHVRGPDLIACYRKSQSPEVSAETYWRAIPAELMTKGGVELIVSAQTNELAGNPRLLVVSQVPELELCQVLEPESLRFHKLAPRVSPMAVEAGGALLYRMSEKPFSFLEMVHPSDFGGLDVSLQSSKSPACASRFWLFDESLEKGVIRRARLRGIFLPRAGDQEAAIACYRQFIESALPLTA